MMMSSHACDIGDSGTSILLLAYVAACSNRKVYFHFLHYAIFCDNCILLILSFIIASDLIDYSSNRKLMLFNFFFSWLINADKYMEYVAPDSGAVDRDLDKLSLRNENGFLWDIVSPGLEELPKEEALPNASTAEV